MESIKKNNNESIKKNNLIKEQDKFNVPRDLTAKTIRSF